MVSVDILGKIQLSVKSFFLLFFFFTAILSLFSYEIQSKYETRVKKEPTSTQNYMLNVFNIPLILRHLWILMLAKVWMITFLQQLYLDDSHLIPSDFLVHKMFISTAISLWAKLENTLSIIHEHFPWVLLCYTAQILNLLS